MAIENPNLPQSTTKIPISTPIQPNPQNQRRSRPRVREVSSRFMSPVTKSSTILPKQAPSTPSESQISKNHSLRRSNTDFRSRYGDENRNYQFNRRSVSPVGRTETSKPRAVVRLFNEGSRPGTPVVRVPGQRLVRQRSFDTPASKLLQASGMNSDSDGDNVSVKSEPIDGCHSSIRVLTPCLRPETGGGGGGGGDGNVSKVVRSLKLPPMGPGAGCSRPQGVVDGKKVAMRKGGSSQVVDVVRLKLLYNCYLQWRFANAKGEAFCNVVKKEAERQLYSMALEISEMRDSVKNKRIEVRRLKQELAVSNILETQMPYLNEWSSLEEAYSSSLMELVQGLLNVASRLPLIGNVKADAEEIKGAIFSALEVVESIYSQVQGFVPKAEEVDGLVFDLARIHNRELALVQECGDLLSKTHLSQIKECTLRAQLMQSRNAKLMSKDDQTSR